MMATHRGTNSPIPTNILHAGYKKMLNIGAVKTVLRILLVVLVLCSGPVFERAEAAPLINGLGGTSGFGTLAMGRNDDGSSGVKMLGAGFPYGIKLFSGNYTNLYINNNGNVTFKAPLGTYTPIPFPITNLPMLAPYWGDVDTRGGTANPLQNNVYYSTAIPGKYIVTWNYVGYYAGATNKLNAFQLILTDRNDIAQGDFDIEYRYEQMQWTTGSASGGSGGLGGTPAQMGYDAGDGKSYYRHPDSQTANILKLTDTSNVDEPGVWRFEVRGGTPNPVKTPNLIDVRLIETLNADNIDIDPASFQVAPYSVTSANGQTLVEWRFAAFPANITKDLSFDVIFKNPLAGENRLLVSKLELLYNDINGNPVKTELGSEYVNVYPSIYEITPSTDKASYGPNEVVQISSTMKNLTGFSGAAAVRLSIQDAGNAPVVALGTTAAQTVAAGATGIFTGLNFQTGNTYVGNYKVLAELVDNTGDVIASGTAPFVIAAASGQSAMATITTDKQIYKPFDTVRISDRVTNLLSNAMLDDLRIVTTVTSPDGDEWFSKAETLPQLSPGALTDYSYDVPLASAAAGQYTASLMVNKADGTQLAQASTQFTVVSTAETGAGLTGTITAAPTLVGFGQTVNLAFSAANNGNSALANLPLKVSIVDPEKQQLVVEYPYSTTLAIGDSHNGSTGWVSGGGNGATYIALLSATIGGKTITLAQTSFTVLKLDIKQALSNESRVLVLLSCNNNEGNGDDEECIATRAQLLDATLANLGIGHLVTVTREDFRSAFRSGIYNVYWISGGALKLNNGLAQEVREAINRGDGLLLDGIHDERNGLLDEVAGVLYRGKLSPVDKSITLTGPLFAPGTLSTVGGPLKLALGDGTQQAQFPAGLKCDDCPDKSDKDGAALGDTPAIVANVYGQGHGMIMAFDLVGSLAQTQPVSPHWQDIMRTTFDFLMPQTPDPLTAGAFAVARTTITNQGPAVALDVTDILPLGATVYYTRPQASVDPGNTQAKWNLSLATGQGADLTLALIMPMASGSHTLATTVNSTWNGQDMLYGSYPLAINVASAMEPAATSHLIAELQALSFSASSAREARDQAIKALQDAVAKTAQGKYEDAIGNLLDAIDKLNRVTGMDMSAYRLAVDRWLQELELEWLLAQPLNQAPGE